MRIIVLAFVTSLALFGWVLYTIYKRIQMVPRSPSLTEQKAGFCTLPNSLYKDGNKRYQEVKKRLLPHLKQALSKKGLFLGDPVYLRSFKKERELELWIKNRDKEKFMHAHTWKIANISGNLGPKFKEGDKQSPEGFYSVSKHQFLPSSTNHLAFNVGYPNRFDRAHGRTGSFIMVHGKTGSVGCLAMTDPFIEEIYTICQLAIESGAQQKFHIHMFPFRMTEKNMTLHSSSEWFHFWTSLKSGYDYFEQHQHPPNVFIRNRKYVVE